MASSPLTTRQDAQDAQQTLQEDNAGSMQGRWGILHSSTRNQQRSGGEGGALPLYFPPAYSLIRTENIFSPLAQARGPENSQT